MKWLNHILAFYLVLLAVVPCCAFDNCPDERPVTQQAGQHEKGDKDNCGSCSPFFNCEGCASSTTPVSNFSLSIFIPDIRRMYAGFIPPSIPDVHYDFWQPPRLD